jgi:hypothetical protein
MGPLENRVLDGNAIGGLLLEVFGSEMTAVVGTCGRCGTAGQVAEFAVYQPGLGTVVRCRHCDNVLMVFVRARGVTCVDLWGLASLALRQVGWARSRSAPWRAKNPSPRARAVLAAPDQEEVRSSSVRSRAGST